LGGETVSARTPEEIAEHIAWQTYTATRKPDGQKIVLTRQSFVTYMKIAAREALRDAAE
jgi:hypothetical protein